MQPYANNGVVFRIAGIHKKVRYCIQPLTESDVKSRQCAYPRATRGDFRLLWPLWGPAVATSKPRPSLADKCATVVRRITVQSDAAAVAATASDLLCIVSSNLL